MSGDQYGEQLGLALGYAMGHADGSVPGGARPVPFDRIQFAHAWAVLVAEGGSRPSIQDAHAAWVKYGRLRP